MLGRYWHALDPLFPEQEIYIRQLPLKVIVLVFILLTIIFSLAGTLVPNDGFYGFDWTHFWGIQRIPPFYPPWTSLVIRYMSYPLLIGITMAAFSIATYQRSIHPISALAAFFSLPLLWTLFLGQLEGWVLLGMLGLPWLIPLILIKPQISFFGLGARRSYILAFFIFII